MGKKKSKKQNKRSAAEESAAEDRGGGKPSVEYSRREKDARARGNKGARSARGVGPVCEKCGEIHKRCSAHNNRGGPCGQQPLRFQQVCRSHGGNNKLSRVAAQERMMEMVDPALARLEQLVRDPKTDPAIVMKAVREILDRAHAAGLSRNAHLALSFGKESEWDRMGSSVVVEVDRNIEAPPDAKALSSGGEGDDEDEELNAVLDARERARERDASTRIKHDGHEVVRGEVKQQREAADPFFRDEKERRHYNRTRSEMEGQRMSDDERTYEERLRDQIDETERQGRKR